MTWDTHRIEFGDDLHSFRFLYVDTHEGKERVFEKRYNVADIYEAIKGFRKLNLTLASLFLEVEGKGNTLS